MPDPSPSTLTVLNSNFLQLGRRSGGRPQRAVHPHGFNTEAVNTVIHTTLVGLEPATFRSLVRRATSSATEPALATLCVIQENRTTEPCPRSSASFGDRSFAVCNIPLAWDRVSEILPFMAAFHIQISFIYTIYKWFKRSGISDELVAAGVISDGSVDQALLGKHFKR